MCVCVCYVSFERYLIIILFSLFIRHICKHYCRVKKVLNIYISCIIGIKNRLNTSHIINISLETITSKFGWKKAIQSISDEDKENKIERKNYMCESVCYFICTPFTLVVMYAIGKSTPFNTIGS